MNAPLPVDRLRAASLDDKYTLHEGWAFMSGNQALVRLALQQRMRDAAAGLNTAGFISGYRGSPLGRYDIELWRIAETLKSAHIHFQPGVNEDLAATAVWGTQHVGAFGGAKYDGVFSIWYGKTPGVDRSADALRHANAAGTSKSGGVLALCGDDHGAKSSTQAGQSDYILIATGIPVLYPANVQDILDLGLHGLAMSRHAGCWVGLKLVTDVVESSASVQLGLDRPSIVVPPHSEPEDGLAIRTVDTPLAQESRLYNHKLPAALAYARSNGLNRITIDCERPRLGIIAAGKGYADARQALLELGLDAAQAAERGVRLLKIGMVWPLDPEIVAQFARDLDTILVVEEKRPVLEDQLKSILFDLRTTQPIRVVGKFDGANVWTSARGGAMLPSTGELSPAMVAARIAALLGMEGDVVAAPEPASTPGPVRMPSFCSGCPHNTSTRVPEGSRALAGIGCHTIAMFQQPTVTTTVSHMGGEGVMWVGQAPFTEEKHVFANLGDGTYFHSGFLAVRQAIAAKVNITYKLLVNGFVSMTGGQPVDGELSIPQMATELLAEGASRVVVVADDLARYRDVKLPAGVALEPRRDLERVQLELREVTGVSVLIYDQMCATERRRLRKRGRYPDVDKRTFIHTEVCEGCGDCSVKSNCMSVEPVHTELGRKRRINQASCNKDFSCVDGFCPSFVTVHGARLRGGRPVAGEGRQDVPPAPELPVLGERPYGILITGIGGTGVVTVGAVLAMAAHLDGKAVSSLDVTGLAQKYGAVMSHIRLAGDPRQLQSSRLASREADVMLGCDLIVSSGDEALARLAAGRSHAVVNTELTPTSEFLRNPDWSMDEQTLLERIRERLDDTDRLSAVPASRLATRLLGDPIAGNMFLLGYAWQRGWIPVTQEAIERAIELNGVAVELNQAAFLWGRRVAHAPEQADELIAPAAVVQLMPTKLNRLDDIVADRVARLRHYQNAAYAQRYRRLVDKVAEAEAPLGGERLARTVARQYYKLLAYKDEFEVARLYCAPEFRQQLAQTFEGDYKLRFHLGAWPFVSKDPVTGLPRKRELGGWVMPALRMLAAMRGLRGTLLDPFRKTAERELALQLIADYEADVDRILRGLTAERHALAVEIAGWPEKVRGYGHVRAAGAQEVSAARNEWEWAWDNGVRVASRAA